MTQTASNVQIEGRYDGSCGFIYAGENARIFFAITMEKTPHGSAATISFSPQRGDITPTLRDAIYGAARAYTSNWLLANGYSPIAEGR